MDIPIAELIVSIIGLLGAVLTAFISKFLNEKVSTEVRGYLVSAVEMGIAFAVRKVEDKAPTIEVKNEMAALAIGYVLRNVPDTLKKLKISEETVKNMVEARLGLVEVFDTSNDTSVQANTSFAPRPITVSSAIAETFKYNPVNAVAPIAAKKATKAKT